MNFNIYFLDKNAIKHLINHFPTMEMAELYLDLFIARTNFYKGKGFIKKRDFEIKQE
jgi:hypothetical protein